MTRYARCWAVLLIVLILTGCCATGAYAQDTAETQASAAKVTQLLHDSGYTFTQKTPTVWTVNYQGQRQKNFRVIFATEGDLLVTFIVIAPNAKLQVTDEFLHRLLRLNARNDRVKRLLDSDGDLDVRVDSSVRILDAQEFKAVVNQVTAAADEVY